MITSVCFLLKFFPKCFHGTILRMVLVLVESYANLCHLLFGSTSTGCKHTHKANNPHSHCQFFKQSEVYTALQQGVIDAAENSELVYRDFKHYEVAPYYAYTRHIVHPDVVLASTAFLDSMSEEDRAIFDQLIKESTEEEFSTFKADIEVAKKDAEAAGTQFCYPDTNELRERCMPLLNRIANQSEVTKKIYDAVVALREEAE